MLPTDSGPLPTVGRGQAESRRHRRHPSVMYGQHSAIFHIEQGCRVYSVGSRGWIEVGLDFSRVRLWGVCCLQTVVLCLQLAGGTEDILG